jgi:hypothetical protein
MEHTAAEEKFCAEKVQCLGINHAPKNPRYLKVRGGKPGILFNVSKKAGSGSLLQTRGERLFIVFVFYFYVFPNLAGVAGRGAEGII